MKNLAWFAAVALSTACQVAPGIEEQSGSSVLGFTMSNDQVLSEVKDTPTAGTYARANNYVAGGGAGLNLADAADPCANTLKVGQRVVISASYGRGGEAGQLAGTVALCKEQPGLPGEQDWEPGELCFLSDGMSTTTQLLNAPGSPLPDVINGPRGSLMSLTEYCRLAVRFHLGLGAKSYGLADDAGSYQGDGIYGATQGKKADMAVQLANESFNLNGALIVDYSLKGAGLTEGRAASETRGFYAADGKGLVGIEFEEDGFGDSGGGLGLAGGAYGGPGAAGTFKIYFGGASGG